MTYYRPMTKEDIVDVLALDLRKADRAEAKAALNAGSADALAYSLANSVEVWVVIHLGKIEAVFGICLGGIPWFLATDKFKEFKITFAKESKSMVKALLRKYGTLQNTVDSRNEDAIKWLRWLGFIVDAENEIYLYDYNVPFYSFILKEVVT